MLYTLLSSWELLCTGFVTMYRLCTYPFRLEGMPTKLFELDMMLTDVHSHSTSLQLAMCLTI